MRRLLSQVALAWTLFSLLAHQVEGQTGQPCSSKPALTKNQIHDGTEGKNAWEVMGLGGRYGLIKNSFLSKACFIDSDHFPPKSAYKYAQDDFIKNIPEDDMAAVSVSHTFHEAFFTTKNNIESQCIMELYFQAGDYYGAIEQNIKWYVLNPSRTTGQKRMGNLHLIREGIIGGLEIHVKNGLITEAQKNKLIEEYHLTSYKRANIFSNILHSERRDAARLHIQCDTFMYNPKRNNAAQRNPEKSKCAEPTPKPCVPTANKNKRPRPSG